MWFLVAAKITQIFQYFAKNTSKFYLQQETNSCFEGINSPTSLNSHHNYIDFKQKYIPVPAYINMNHHTVDSNLNVQNTWSKIV